MIFYHWSWLCISSESWHDHFVRIVWHQLLLEPNIHCHTTLHYECSCCKLWLYFSKKVTWLVNKGNNLWNFPHVLHNGFLQRWSTRNSYLKLIHHQNKQQILPHLIFDLKMKHEVQVHRQYAMLSPDICDTRNLVC